MPIWNKNEPDPERRRTTLIVVEDDGVSPAPMGTDFSSGNLFRISGGAYAAASGSMLNVGIDGEWEYTATQAETNADASEAVVMIPAVTILGVNYLASRSIAQMVTATIGKDEPSAVRRKVTVFIFEDDGVTPADKTTDFSTGNLIRYSGGAYHSAAGSMLNVGVDGEWEYTFTQAETNVDSSEILVLVPAQTIGPTSYNASKAIVALAASIAPPPPPPPPPPPIPAITAEGAAPPRDHLAVALMRLPAQFPRQIRQ